LQRHCSRCDRKTADDACISGAAGVLPPPPSQDGGVEIDATIQFGAADCLLRLGRAPTIGPSARKNAKAAAACVLLLLLLPAPSRDARMQ
jgi:hypothetical protein